MNFLRRIPFWAWLVMIVGLCYAVWNPVGFSIYHLWLTDAGLFVKLVPTFVVVVLISMLLIATFNALGTVGIIIYLVGVGLMLGLLWELGVFTADKIGSVKYWGQIAVGLLLTLGLQGNKIWFAITGTRGVRDPDTVPPDTSSDD